jgi:hypothetical protein
MGAAEIIFGYCIGGFALVSTISSAVFFCRRFSPTTQLKVLDELLKETKDIYRKANDEMLLQKQVFIYAQTHLRRSVHIPLCKHVLSYGAHFSYTHSS